MKPRRAAGRRIYGVTGGIASGKSTVMALLKRAGIPGESADAIAHRCLQPGHPAYRQILSAFGPAVRSPSGGIDRAQLAKRVFRSPRERRRLERIVHPYVIRALKAYIRKQKGTIALDIPLLFEADLTDLVDRIVVVYARRNQQLTRLRERNGLSATQARQRLRAQWPLSKKVPLSHVVLRNTGSLARLQEEVREWLRREKDLDSLHRYAIIRADKRHLNRLSQSHRTQKP